MEDRSRDCTLLLVRHGESVWNAEGRVQGHQDSRLSERGREQSRLAAEHLSRLSIGAIYSSDLGRAQETADMIAAPHGLTVATASALRERNYGVLEGQTVEDAARTQGIWFLPWQADRLNSSPPGGERQPEMCQRVVEALRAIARAYPGQTVVVVTHGGPIKSAIYEVLRIPLALWNLTWVANGSITTLQGTPDVFRIACINDTCHLRAAYPKPDEPTPSAREGIED
jgi:broad specificity phosphatase PhoE